MPRSAHRAASKTAPLLDWQRVMFQAVTRPLTGNDQTNRRWSDGRRSVEVIDELVKPGKAMQPIERLQIYNRMYWYRLLECVADDHPGLRSLLGQKRFWALAKAYLDHCPSRSFTLRNLCDRLARFIFEHPELTAPHSAAAYDLARFEWAQIVAFDGASLPALTAGQLAGADPMTLRVRLQPYLTLLSLHHAVDEYARAVKSGGALRSEASNAVLHVDFGGQGVKKLRIAPPAAERIHLAVHRLDFDLYYKRLEPEAIRMLRALRAGRTLADACAGAFLRSRLEPEEQIAKVQSWCALWIQLGWIAARP